MGISLDDMPIETILRRWPETVRVFLDHDLLCVGCPIAGFHVLSDAAREHEVSLEDLERDVWRVIRTRGTMP